MIPEIFKEKEQNFVERLKERHPNFYSIMIAVAFIMVWRGLKGLMDLYIFPEKPTLSFIFTTVIGLTLLFVNNFNLKEIEF